MNDTPRVKYVHKLSSGLQTGRRWQDVVDALIKANVIYLNKNEYIEEITVDEKYGLMFKISYKTT